MAGIAETYTRPGCMWSDPAGKDLPDGLGTNHSCEGAKSTRSSGNLVLAHSLRKTSGELTNDMIAETNAIHVWGVCQS